VTPSLVLEDSCEVTLVAPDIAAPSTPTANS
jgi:hypothetical protein